MYYHVRIKKIPFMILTFLLLVFGVAVYLYIATVEALPRFITSCGFKSFFHLYCPGCGGTRAVYHLFHLQPIQSLLCHPLVLYIVVCAFYYWGKTLLFLVRQHGMAEFDICLVFLWGMLIFSVLFFIFRNFLLIACHIDYMGDLIQYWQ